MQTEYRVAEENEEDEEEREREKRGILTPNHAMAYALFQLSRKGKFDKANP